MIRRTIVTTLTIFLCAAAEDPATDVDVKAPRLPFREHSATVITPRTIRSSHPLTTADLLRHEPGIDMDTPAGGPAGLSIRGASSAHTLVVVDALIANDPSNPARSYDFTWLDEEDVESIEVLRGPQSLAYGSDALAGVVVVHSRAPEPAPGGSAGVVRGSYGSFNTRAASARLAVRPNSLWSLHLHGGGRESTGFPIADVAGAQADGMRSGRGGGEVRVAVQPNLNLSLGATRMSLHQDLAEGAFTDDPDSTTRTVQTRRHARLTNGKGSDAWRGHVSYATNSIERAYDNPAPEGKSPYFATNYGDTSRAEMQQRYEFSTQSMVLAGVDRTTESMRITALDPTNAMAEESTRALGAYVSGSFRPVSALEFALGGRRDARNEGPDATTWRAGVTAFPDDSRQVGVICGTGYKAPTLFQRHAPLYGNASLAAETARQCEVSYSEAFGSGVTGLISVFRTDYDQLIDFTVRSDQSYGYQNVTKARTQGVEASVDLVAKDRYGVKLHATWQDARNTTTDTQLVRRPRFKTGSRWHLTLTERWDGGLETLYVGQRPEDNENVNGPYFLVHTVTSYTVAQNLTVSARVNNLLGRRFSEVRGYRSPGRHGMTGVEWTF